MNSITVTLIGVGMVIVFIAVVAWLLYKAEFRVTKLVAKLGLVEATVSREADKGSSEAGTSTGRTEVSQKAGEGGVIRKSGVSAPAQSKAKIDQESTGEGSQIDDSPIDLS